VKPLIVFGSGFWAAHPEGRRWASILKYYARYSMILGRLQAEDFGVSSGQSTFDVRNDRVLSRGVLIDFSELLYHR
jgi:hypothetical protein